MEKVMKKVRKSILEFVIISILVVGAFLIQYNWTENRLERIYKIENPTFIDVILEMYR